MNWFERYGIVGMFFIGIIGMWFFCLFPSESSTFLSQVILCKESANFIIGFCGLIFLPIGYLIVISGQFFYYRTNIWEHIHCKYWEELPVEVKKKINDIEKKIVKKILTDDDKKNEAKLEAVLTYYDRMYIEDTKQNMFLSVFATKRYDVIAINRGLILTIYITMFCAASIELTQIITAMLKTSMCCLSRKDLFFALAVIFSLVLRFILRRSSSKLEWQIIEVGKRKLTHILLSKNVLSVGSQGVINNKQDKPDVIN